ncbi:MAG: RNA 3'-terminal phosphate cyclase [Candidatus Nanoarchaeia archaeon]
MLDFIEIDGSYGESGGQILRTAISLSAIKGVPIKVFNIRAGRPEPGLKAQHLTSVFAAAKLCAADVKGAELGSRELEFRPKKIRFGKFKFDIGTAGAITLVLQTLAPIAAFAPGPIELELIGGTNVAWSPPIEFFENVFCDYAEKFGFLITCQTLARGFYPLGGGHVKVKTLPIKNPKRLDLLEQGELFDIKAFSVASENLKQKNVAERQLSAFCSSLHGYKIKTFSEYCKTKSPGSSLYAHALFSNCKLAASALGEPGKPAEQIGQEVAFELEKEIKSGATVDKHLADQLIPFLALFGGQFITSEITQHTKTNIWVCEQFFGKKFKIEKNKISTI